MLPGSLVGSLHFVERDGVVWCGLGDSYSFVFRAAV